MNRVLIGQIYNEANGSQHDFWGSTALRKSELLAAGAVHEGGARYHLPLAGASADLISALSAPIFAAPIASDWKQQDNSKSYVKSVVYSTLYKGELLVVTLWEDSIYIDASAFTLSRSQYKFSAYATRINADVPEARLKPMIGDWHVKPSQYNSFSEAGLRDFDRIIGGLIAGLLRDYPNAIVEGVNQSRADARERAKDKIAKLVKELTEAQNELTHLPADQPVPLSKTEYQEVYETGRRSALDGLPAPITVEQISEKTSPMLAAFVTGWSAGKAEMLTQVQTVIG